MTDTPDIRIVELMEEGITDMPTSPQLPGLTDEQVADMITKHSYARDPQGFQDSVVMTYWHAQQFARTAFAAGCEAQLAKNQLARCPCNCHEAPNEMFLEQHANCLICVRGLIEEEEDLSRAEERARAVRLLRGRRGLFCGEDQERITELAAAIGRTPEQPTTHADCTIANPCAECRKFMGKQPTTQRCGTCGSDNPSEQITDVLKHRTDWVCDDKFHSQPTTGEAQGD